MRDVVVSNSDGVAWIELRRADRANALSAALVDELIAAVNGAIESRAHVLVLSGEGRSFCGGFDLGGLDQETDASLAYRLLRIELLLQTIHYAPMYTVALAHGAISGAGADLVAACAKRVGAPDAQFQFPGIRFGILLGTNRLRSLIGARALSVILEQERLDAVQARQLGLLSQVAEPSEWRGIIDEVRQAIQSVPAGAVGAAMQLDQEAGAHDLGVLARSVCVSGLKERVTAYWERARVKTRNA